MKSRNAHDSLRRLRLAATLLFFLLATRASAAVPGAAEAANAGMVLPSTTCKGLFIVPVTFGGDQAAPVDLVLDTGSTRTFLDPAAVRRILGREVGIGKVLFQHGRVGQHEIGPVRAYMYPMETLSLALGQKIDGILGFPTFRDVLLTLDYPAEEIRVSSGRLPRPDGREVFRATANKRPYLRVDVGGQRVKILLDSGSTGRFTLKSSDRLAWSVRPRPVGASVLFARVTLRESGRLGSALRFGPLRFEAPVVALATHGRLAGWHVLHHFVLTFDQEKKRIRM